MGARAEGVRLPLLTAGGHAAMERPPKAAGAGPEAEAGPGPASWGRVAVLAGATAACYGTVGLLLATTPVAATRLQRLELASLPMMCEGLGRAAGGGVLPRLLAPHGRRRVLCAATVVGLVGYAAACAALAVESFGLFAAAMFCCGISNAAGTVLRFVAGDCVRAAEKSRAISLTTLGGLVGALVGPQLAREGRTLVGTTEFFGCYVFGGGLVILQGLLTAACSLEPRAEAEGGKAGEEDGGGKEEGPAEAEIGLLEVFRRAPAVFIGSASCVTVWAVMCLVMASVPLAVAPKHGFDHSSTIIQLHLGLMFAPCLVNGWIIGRVGAFPVLVAGSTLYAASAFFSFGSLELWSVYACMACQGVAWSWLYVGGSVLVAGGGEKARAANEMATYTGVALAVGLAAYTFSSVGWKGVNQVTLAAMGLFTAFLVAAKRHLEPTAAGGGGGRGESPEAESAPNSAV